MMDDADRVVSACPECDVDDTYRRVSMTPTWRCRRCGHEFAVPNYRPPKDNNTGLTARLASMRPEDAGLSELEGDT